MVLKLGNLKNQLGEKSKIIIHLAKKIQKEQEKTTKTSKNQISPKQQKKKLKSKQPVKTKKQTKKKKQFSKKEINVIRQELFFPGCRGTSAKSFLSSVSVKVF